MEDIKPTVKDDDKSLVELTSSYIEEALNAKQNRMRLNRINFDCYHLRQDYSHKRPGQSQEFLAKQSMAVEQISTFIQQGLVDAGEWFNVENSPGVKNPPITPEEAKLLIMRALDQCDFLAFVGDSVKLGLLQSLMIAKYHGHYVDVPRYYTEVKEVNGEYKDVLKKASLKVWQPKIDLVRAEDYYPDPTGRGLYEIEEIYMDISDLYAMSEGENAIYDRAAVELVQGSFQDADMQAARKASETGQNTTYSNYRKRVKIHQCYGTIIDQDTGKIKRKNVFWTVADTRILIQKPTENKFWHDISPVITSPFIRVPNSVWHKALMDGPTQTNIALNELYNLMVDAGMNDAHGIKQIRADWLEDESQITNGIYPGITLKVNQSCPPGAKVLERVDTSSLTTESLNVFNTMNAEFSASSLTNDLRMGVLPNRAVKATEVVEASQSITSVFTGISKVLEKQYMEPGLDMMWKNILQHLDAMDFSEIADLIGEGRATAILSMSPEERFAKCCQGYKFSVYGISRILAKQKDFKKLTALLQTITASDLLVEEFMKEYSFGGFLNEIMRSLDISIDRIKISEEEKAAQMAQQMAQAGQMGGSQPGQSPDDQSQIQQADSQAGAESVESMIPRSNFGNMEGNARGGVS